MRVLVLALSIAARGLAQTAVTGLLLDPSDRPVPGIEVTLDSRKTVTGPSGNFEFTYVAPGRHALRIAAPGFEPVERTVPVRSSSVGMTIRLAIAAVREHLVIDSDPAGVYAAAGNNRDAIAIDRPLLNDLPVLDLDYLGALSRFVDPSSRVAGEAAGVALVVDGIEARNAGVTASAIQEVRFNQNPYTAEYPRWSRRRIELTTKSGAGRLRGTVNFNLRDSAFDARNAYAAVKADEQRRIVEGNLTGPFIDGSTTSFLVSGAQDEEDSQAAVVARGLNGAIRENVPTPRRDTRGSVRVSHAWSDQHASSAQLSYQDTFNYRLGAGGITLGEAATDSRFREDEIGLNHRSTLSANTITQFRVLIGRYNAPLRSVSPGLRTSVSDAFIGGGAQMEMNRTELHTSMAWIVSQTSGKHTIKHGINIPDWSRRGLSDRSYRGGSYSYASLDDLRLNRPYAALLQTGNPRFVFVEKIVGGFIQDDIQLRPNLSLSLGLRYDWQNYIGSADQFGPRASVAWSPARNRRWVVRAGAGTFFERSGPNPVAEGSRFLPGYLNRYLITSPVMPLRAISGTPRAIAYLEPGIELGRIYQFSAHLERQLYRKTTLSAGYTGWRAPAQLRSRDANAPLWPYTVRPNPEFTTMRVIESSGRAISDGFEVNVRGELGPRIQGTVQYVFSKAMNNATSFSFYPASSTGPSDEWARSDFDRRQQLNILATARIHPWANFGIAASALSSVPFNITTGRDENRDGLALDRPAGVGRNTGTGPSQIGLDLRWFHDFRRSQEGPSMTLSLDSFNLLNRTNATGYIGALSSPFFGSAVSALPPRRMQLGFRYQF